MHAKQIPSPDKQPYRRLRSNRLDFGLFAVVNPENHDLGRQARQGKKLAMKRLLVDLAPRPFMITHYDYPGH